MFMFLDMDFRCSLELPMIEAVLSKQIPTVCVLDRNRKTVTIFRLNIFIFAGVKNQSIQLHGRALLNTYYFF